MIKVAFYNHTSAVSGAEISMLLTAKHMKHTEVVIYAPLGELTERADRMGIKTVEVSGFRARLTKNPIGLTLGLLGMIKSGIRFANTVKRHQADLIHANSLRAGIMASMFAWLHRKPVIWHVRDMPPGGAIGSMIRLLASAGARRLIGISESVLHSLSGRKLAERSRIVHNGVELSKTPEPLKRKYREQIRSELQTSSAGHVLVIIGQIARWKRQEDAIYALKELLDDNYDVTLWIVGEPKFRQENMDYFEQLKQLSEELNVQKNVRFTGFREDIPEICCAADLLLLCSDHEPFGRVIIEAMSQGTPVVATNAGGVPEIITDNEDGLLYEVKDVKVLAGQIKTLLDSAELRSKVGEKAVLKVEQLFDIDQTANKIEEIYRQIHHDSPGRKANQQRVTTSSKVYK